MSMRGGHETGCKRCENICLSVWVTVCPPPMYESVSVHMWVCVCACCHHFMCGTAHRSVRRLWEQRVQNISPWRSLVWDSTAPACVTVCMCAAPHVGKLNMFWVCSISLHCVTTFKVKKKKKKKNLHLVLCAVMVDDSTTTIYSRVSLITSHLETINAWKKTLELRLMKPGSKYSFN